MQGDLSKRASLSQYFLHDEDTIASVIEAAAIGPGDRVLDLGGGLGTISRAVPTSATLTTVDLDERLLSGLARRVPHATVVHGDGLEVVRTHPFDVLISSLPIGLGEVLIREVLPGLAWRVAVVAIEPDSDLGVLAGLHRSVDVIAMATGHDYRPFQPAVSRFVRLRSRPPGSPATASVRRGGSL